MNQPRSEISQPAQNMEEEVAVYDGIKVELPEGSDEKNGEEEVLSETVASDEEQQQVECEGALSGSSSDEDDVENDDSSEGMLAVDIPVAGSGLPPAPLPVSPVSTSTFVPDFNKAVENSARLAHRREPCAFPRLRELQRTHPEVIELALLVDEVRISNKGTDASF